MAEAKETTETTPKVKVEAVTTKAKAEVTTGKKRSATDKPKDDAKRAKIVAEEDNDAGGMTYADFVAALKNLDGGFVPEKPVVEEEAPVEPNTSVQDMDADEFLEAASNFLQEKKPATPRRENRAEADVDPTVAKVVNKMLRVKLDRPVMNSLTRRCQRPGNVENLNITVVNNGVWKQLNADLRGDDLVMQGMQRTLVTGMAPLTMAMDALYKVQEGKATKDELDVRKLLGQVTDTMTMLSRCYNRINIKRRQMLAPFFEAPYKNHATQQVISTDQLFGEQIQKGCTEGKVKLKKVVDKVQSSQAGSGRGGGAFAGRGGNAGRSAPISVRGGAGGSSRGGGAGGSSRGGGAGGSSRGGGVQQNRGQAGRSDNFPRKTGFWGAPSLQQNRGQSGMSNDFQQNRNFNNSGADNFSQNRQGFSSSSDNFSQNRGFSGGRDNFKDNQSFNNRQQNAGGFQQNSGMSSGGFSGGFNQSSQDFSRGTGDFQQSSSGFSGGSGGFQQNSNFSRGSDNFQQQNMGYNQGQGQGQSNFGNGFSKDIPLGNSGGWAQDSFRGSGQQGLGNRDYAGEARDIVDRYILPRDQGGVQSGFRGDNNRMSNW